MEERKTIKSLGNISGDLLIFGGVYSNLQSLEALKRWADEKGYPATHIFCTGDILGYCAQPVECVELIREWGIHTIAGNVELQISNREADCGCHFPGGGRCDLFSRNWYAYTRSKINDDMLQWLQTLPNYIQFTYSEKKVMLVHGSWFNTSDFIFRSTPWTVKVKNFVETGSDIVVGGHCGLPFADEQKGGLWLNAGVIGMPANDGTDRVWFITLHQSPDKVVYKFHHYQYNNELAAERMRQNALPLSYAQTLISGIWDNCEILPEEETAQQGKPLYFETAY